MKKRVLSLTLCLIMLLSSVPLADFSNIFVVEASAVSVEALEECYESIPEKSQWEKLYLDSSTLELWYDSATEILAKPSDYTQTQIDNTAKSLQTAFNSLQYHTQEIALNKTAVTLEVGQDITLKATLDPLNAADGVKWQSSNTEAVEVTDEGKVTVKKYSSSPVYIYATSNGHRATCTVTTTNPLGAVKISQTSKTIYDSQSFILSAVYSGVDSSSACTENVTLTWSSSKNTVASVGSTGVVTGHTAGTAVITVTAKSATKTYTASCTVTVKELIEVTGLLPQTTTNNGVLTMVIGETSSFKVKITPETASIKTLSWKNSDSTIASMTSTGIDGSVAYANFKALKAGKTTVTYSATDGSEKSGSFVIEVLPLVSFLSLSETNKVVPTGSSGNKLVATVLPTNAGNQVLNWSSSDTSICQVDNAGVLIPKKNGVCTIYAKTTDGSNITVSCRVRVAPIASSVSLNKTEASLKTGNTVSLTATVKTTEGTTYGDVEWVSENTKVATVSSSGVVTAKYPGTAKIKAITLDGTEKSAVCVVTVTQPVTGVTLTSSKTMGVGTSATLTATIEPSYASNKNLTWKSSDTSIATVDSNGKVTAKNKVGSCTITVTTSDGGYKATCTVKVVILTTSIKLNKSSASIKAGNSLALTATVAPTNATDKTVTWTSSNTSVATVSSSGVVKALAGGSCTITATSSGGQKATCTVSVSQDAQAVTLDKNILTLYVSQQYTLKTTLTPSTATVNNYTWTSSNTAVAVVSSAGKITAVKEGVAVITVSIGSVKATCTVNVVTKIPVTGITIPNEVSLLKGESYAIDSTISPSNASNKNITWTSSNTSVATVSSSGVVKAVGTGRAVITAKTSDGGYTDTCNIYVTQKVTGVKITTTDTKVAVGKTKTLIANVFPTDATNRSVTWSSSNTSVVTVTQTGVIKGIKSGSATITVTTADGGYTASCNVNVYIAVTGVKLNATSLTVPKGETKMLSAIVSPSNATDQTMKWTSSDSSIASVSSAGQVTAKKTGSVVITATTTDGYYKATCKIVVVQLATKVTLDYTSVTLNVGKTKTLKATLKPSTVTNKTIKWSSSNKKIAKVNSSGKITAVAAGTVTIKAKSGDGKVYATCRVTVIQPVTSIKLGSKTASVKIGRMKVITATVNPADASNQKLTWSSSDEKIATVDSDGVVKGIKKGTVTITASAENGQVKATCKVTVTKSVKGVSVDKTSVTMAVGKKTTITATVTPKSASNQKVTWSSNNYDVADVDKNGVVTAKGKGYAEITAKTKDGGYTAVCRITVIQPVKGIKLSSQTKTLDVGEAVTLKATISPKNASNTAVKWSSSNKKVVKVSSSGKITALKEGTATITVKSVDGGYKATCKVTVIRKVKDVTLNKSSMVLYLDKIATLKATVTPSSATNKAVTWTSSNTKVVRVSSKGKLTPVKPGTATITVKTKQGGLVAKCTVKVERAVTSLKLSKSSLTLKSGKTYTLKTTISPSNATNKTIKWTSSNKKVATVNSKGVITAVGGGTATITAKTSNGIVKKCKITVIQAASGVYFKNTAVSVYTGNTAKLSAVVTPSGATDKSVKWTSSNTSVAKVASDGTVSAIKAGKATITVTTVDGGYKATCTVTVLQHVTGIKLAQSSVSIAKGKTASVTPTVLPSDASNKNVTWSSSNKAVATVTASGQIKALSCGETVITATTADKGYKATCVVTVYEPVTGITADPEITTMFVGDKLSINAAVSPSDATNKLIRWSSSDSLVASVTSSGVVTANKSGTCTITAVTVDGNYKAVCAVTVWQKAQGIVLDKPTLSVNAGSTAQLTASVLPLDSYDKSVTWESDCEEIATVDENGLVTGVEPGTAKITVTSTDGSFTATCDVTVTRAVTGIEISEDSVTVYKGKTHELSAVVSPFDATDKTVIWRTSDSLVATVENGVITAKEKGSAIITAETADGGFKKVCTVDVIIGAESVKLSNTSVSVKENETVTVTAVVLPENAENKNVTWQSENEEIATVENGVITGISKGDTVIKAVSDDNSEIFAECNVTVLKPVTSVSIQGESAVIYNGESLILTAVVLPEDASDKSIVWTSSDENVAIVEDGVVTGISRGQAVITAETADGGFKDEFSVEVKQYAESITFEKETYELIRGESLTLSAVVLPENANDKTLVWSSSDESVAAVSDAVVSGIKEGTVTITVKASVGNAQKTISVEVIEPATSVTLSEESAVLWTGDSKTVTATVLPKEATYKDVTWQSEDESIATVENGVITAVSAGETNIVAVSHCKKASAKIAVTVRQAATQIKLSNEKISLDENGDEQYSKYQLSAQVLPETAYDKTLTWKSLDETVATVDESGLVTAKGKGETKIVVTSADGKAYAECAVTVLKIVTDISISESEMIVEKGKSVSLTATVLPEDATDKSVTWKSSDESVAAVDENGKVTALKAGTATITAVSSNENVTASCNVTVEVYSESVSFESETAELWLGEATSFKVTVLPQDVSDKSVTWKSSDESVVSVNESGIITANKAGTAEITVTTNDTGKTASCTVTVSIKEKSLSLNKNSLTLKNGESEALSFEILPENATYKTVTWSSSNTSVATVDADGRVTAKKAGTAEITAKSKNGITAVCTVSVTQKPSAIEFVPITMSLDEGEEKEINVSFTPSDSTETKLIWTSSDESVATVENGVVKAVSKGEAVITAVSAYDSAVKATCSVEVIRRVSAVSLSDSEKEVYVGGKFALVANVTPSTANDTSLKWTSSDSTVATVDSAGTVNAIKAGTAIISVVTGDGGYKAACFVTVKTPITKLSFNVTSLTLEKKESETLKVTLTPSNASADDIVWTSSDESVATVSGGVVTAGSTGGKAVITAYSKLDESVVASCTVTVIQHVSQVVISDEELTLSVGKTYQLEVTVLPSAATDKTVKWTTSDSSVVKVSENGLLTAVGAGTAIITVKSVDGEITAVCLVTVQ